MVLITHNDNQSSVLISYTIFITHVLGHTVGVIVLDMVHYDEDRLDAQFVLQTLQGDIHAVYRLLLQNVVGVRHILRRVFQIGNGDIVRIPVCLGSLADSLTGCRSGVRTLFGNGSQMAQTAHKQEHNAHVEEYAPALTPCGPNWIGLLVGGKQQASLLLVLLSQYIVLVRILLLQRRRQHALHEVSLRILHVIGILQSTNGIVVLACELGELLEIVLHFLFLMPKIP